MLYAFIGVACLVGLVVLAVDRDPDPVPAPQWVRAPQAEGYYTGVGLARRAGDKAGALRRAEEEARGNLAQNIWAEVATVTQVSQEEVGAAYWEHFSSQVQVSSAVVVPGALVADRWYDPVAKIHYCYIKVSRANLASFQAANQRQVEAYLDAEQARIAGLDKATAMLVYVRRQVELLEYMRRHYQGGLVGGEYRLQLIHQTRQLYAELADVLAGVQWQGEPAAPVPALIPVETALEVRASYQGRPLAGVPITARWDRGYGLLEERAESGLDGAFEVGLYQINSIGPDNRVTLAAQVYALVADSLLAVYPRAPQTQVTFPSFDSHKALTCYVTTVEGGGYLGLNELQGRLAGYMGRNGFRVLEAEPLKAGVGPRAEEGLWIVLSVRRQRAGAALAQWRVYNTQRSDRVCRSGIVRQENATDSRVGAEQLQQALYTKIKGSIADAVGACMGL
ncbi:MAG: hypothetical protein GKR89_25540 [Candidatus Latescibacteria bacterium]|nr:hypothetical protein [Candidatus Latescibacterota bacterium]